MKQTPKVINKIKKKGDMKIITKGGKLITRKKLFAEKELFHKQLAKLPFERKIRMLVQLQKITDSILRLPKKKQIAWKIFPELSDKIL